MTKLIIFDWDDVFTHGSTEGYYACYQAAVDSLMPGIDVNILRQVVKELWGRPARDILARILGDRTDLVEKAHEQYEKHLFSNTFLDKLTFVSGGHELLDRLSRNYKLAVATGSHPRLLKELVMPKFSVPKELFVQIISSYDLPDQARGKPHPDMIHVILGAQHVAPEEAVMVGDAPGDMKMALTAKVHPIAVLTGHLTRGQAESLGIEDIIADVTKIETLLN